MRVNTLRRSQIDEWRRLRQALWPEVTPDRHNREMADILGDLEFNSIFIGIGAGKHAVGFLEASIRLTAEGCRPGPIGYIEAWYVEPESRRSGTGAALLAKAEAWAASRGCTQMASDTEVDNLGGRQAHNHLGYEEIARLAHFRKELRAGR
jgi:aminoglycoside 6'-N-acetyltransferase I